MFSSIHSDSGRGHKSTNAIECRSSEELVRLSFYYLDKSVKKLPHRPFHRWPKQVDPQARKPAIHFNSCFVVKSRMIALLLQYHIGRTLDFAHQLRPHRRHQPVPRRCIGIFHLKMSRKVFVCRPKPNSENRTEQGRVMAYHLITALDALLQDVRIIEGAPDLFTIKWQCMLVADLDGIRRHSENEEANRLKFG